MGTQRKAWNEAMKSAGSAKTKPSNRRSSSRGKKQARRNQARKSTLGVGAGIPSESNGLDHAQYQASIRIDVLEGVADHGLGGDTGEEDDFLDEEEKKPSNRRKRAKRSKSSDKDPKSKRLKPRSLASLLMEDSARSYGNTQKYLAAEARAPRSSVHVITNEPSSSPDQPQILKITRRIQTLPKRKFCPVTGLFGIYADPKSGIPYANLKALDQIQERAPPWLNASSSSYGNATYFEAINSLRGED